MFQTFLGGRISSSFRTLAAVALFLTAISHYADALTPRERNFAFEYVTVVKDIPAGAKQLELWLPVPHNDPYQVISNLRIESSQPYQVHSAQYGNEVLSIRVKAPQPAGFTVALRFNATRREHINPLLGQNHPLDARKEQPDRDMARWLQPDRLAPLDEKIKGWALEVVEAAHAKTDLEKARAIYDHIVATVKYDKSGQGWGRGDIYYACEARRGNCTDFHAIFIGYCRSLGIPARFAIGFPLPADRGDGQISGYHCWAEFYVKDLGWVPVDASEAAKDPNRRAYFFGAHDENRVEFTRGRDLRLNPQQKGDALNYFIYPYAELDGKPFSGVDRILKYRDLTQAQ
ncbi:MAG TPA: transglutaminase domain-containing protein [Blastocatellia bacterium]|nr:transglutaminase domain-containing protein [Blastocatellia bacterium]